MGIFAQIFRESSKGAFIVFLAFLLLDGIAEQIMTIGKNAKGLLPGCVLLIPVAATLIFVCQLIFRLEDDAYGAKIAIALVCFSLVLRLIWIFTLDSYQVNDFGLYLNDATDKTGTLWSRVAFYTYPLVLIFGKSLVALKIANVLTATVTTWIFFVLGRMIVGTRAAALALLFFMWHPGLWYSMTLASHDVPGLFWLGIFFYLSVFLQRRLWDDSKSWFSNLVISIILGGCVFFLGAVRSYQYGAIVALAACAAVHSVLLIFPKIARQSRPVRLPESLALRNMRIGQRLKYAVLNSAFLFLVPVAVYLLGTSVWKVLKLGPDRVGNELVCYITAMDVLGSNTYEEIANWHEEQCPIIKKDEQREFAFRKLIHEITHSPWEYLLHIERKNRILSRADAYLEWSTSTTYETWDTTHDQVKRINRFNYSAQQAAIALANAVLMLLVLWRILRYPAGSIHLAAIIPICFSITYYCMFLFILESQSRYNIFLIFIFSWIAAEAVVDLKQTRHESLLLPVRAFAFNRLYLGGTVILLATAGTFIVASKLVAETSLTLRDQAGFTEPPSGDVLDQVKGCPEVVPVFVTNNFKQLIMAYPAGSGIPSGRIMAAQRTFSVAKRPLHHLRFFLSTAAVTSEPFSDKISWEGTDIEYFVAVNHRLIASGKVNDIPGNMYFSFDSAQTPIFSSSMTLQLVLRNLSSIPRVDSDRGPVLALEYIDLQ